MPLVSFYNPGKYPQQTKVFLRFAGGIERDQCHEMS